MMTNRRPPAQAIGAGVLGIFISFCLAWAVSFTGWLPYTFIWLVLLVSLGILWYGALLPAVLTSISSIVLIDYFLILDGGVLGPSVTARTVMMLVVLMVFAAFKKAHEQAERYHDELKDAIASRDQFITTASHELKTPLTSALLQVEMLKDMVGANKPEILTKRIGALEKQLSRMDRLIGELLDVARINNGKLQLHIEEVNLSEVVKEVLERKDDWFKTHNCVVVHRLDEDVVGYWDKMRIDQVLTNLISNACKYGKGKPIEVELKAVNGCAILSVKDNGIGMLAEDKPKIFERFERGHNGDSAQGIGLGLWITKNIVERFNGTIEVESQVGSGSTFTVKLPRN